MLGLFYQVRHIQGCDVNVQDLNVIHLLAVYKEKSMFYLPSWSYCCSGPACCLHTIEQGDLFAVVSQHYLI